MFRFVVLSLALAVSGTKAIQCHTVRRFEAACSSATSGSQIHKRHVSGHCHHQLRQLCRLLLQHDSFDCGVNRGHQGWVQYVEVHGSLRSTVELERNLFQFAQNKCIGTTFQNIPISLCCCNTPLCNAGGEAAIQ